MNNHKLNKALHDKFFGCWHEPSSLYGRGVCGKCGLVDYKNYARPSYSTNWTDYGKLLEKVKKEKNWFEFCSLLHEKKIWEGLLDVKLGSEAIADFFCKGWGEK